MARQASSWLHLDNGFISLRGLWNIAMMGKLCPSSLIHKQWNEQESKIIPRDIVIVRECGDPAPPGIWWVFIFLWIAAFCWKGTRVAAYVLAIILLLVYGETLLYASNWNPFLDFLHSLSIHCHHAYVSFHGLSFSPRSVSGLDKEPDLVHMEAHTPDGSECLLRTHVHQRGVMNKSV